MKIIKKLIAHIKAFTLVELMVVVAILALLSVTGFIFFNGYFMDSRNSLRQSQLEDIKTVLDSEQTLKKFLPKCADGDVTCDFSPDGIDEDDWNTIQEKLKSVPSDPRKNKEGDIIYYKYFVNNASSPSEYRIWASMETSETPSVKGYFRGSGGSMSYPSLSFLPEYEHLYASLLLAKAGTYKPPVDVSPGDIFDPTPTPTPTPTPNPDPTPTPSCRGTRCENRQCVGYSCSGSWCTCSTPCTIGNDPRCIFAGKDGIGVDPKTKTACQLSETDLMSCVPYTWD